MSYVHVECFPDEALVKEMGILKSDIVHHAGKSRVFHALKMASNAIALVDEDPGSPKTAYERGLIFMEERYGIRKYSDANQNVILVLKIKLEDWLIEVCRNQKVDLSQWGLSNNPSRMHEIIHQRLRNFERLLVNLQEEKNAAIAQLKLWLKSE